MAALNYFSLTALPALDPPGAVPPLAREALAEGAPPGRPLALVRVVLLADDLLRREAALAGELDDPDPVILTPEQAVGEAPLPSAIAPRSEAESRATVPADAVWHAYFHHADRTARRLKSPLLGEWLGYEVALRNGLAAARAKALGLEAGRYVVAKELERESGVVDGAVALWAAATDPLSGARALIGARWRWIEQQEPWFSFRDDEFVAYAVKLVLLHRWHRTGDGSAARREPERAVEVA